MRLFTISLVFWVCFTIGAVLAQMQQAPRAVIIPSQGNIPEAVVVKWDAPDTTQVCAQWPKGNATCRSVKEFREWIVRSSTQQFK